MSVVTYSSMSPYLEVCSYEHMLITFHYVKKGGRQGGFCNVMLAIAKLKLHLVCYFVNSYRNVAPPNPFSVGVAVGPLFSLSNLRPLLQMRKV